MKKDTSNSIWKFLLFLFVFGGARLIVNNSGLEILSFSLTLFVYLLIFLFIRYLLKKRVTKMGISITTNLLNLKAINLFMIIVLFLSGTLSYFFLNGNIYDVMIFISLAVMLTVVYIKLPTKLLYVIFGLIVGFELASNIFIIVALGVDLSSLGIALSRVIVLIYGIVLKITYIY